jgi:hypothetical protein
MESDGKKVSPRKYRTFFVVFFSERRVEFEMFAQMFFSSFGDETRELLQQVVQVIRTNSTFGIAVDNYGSLRGNFSD